MSINYSNDSKINTIIGTGVKFPLSTPTDSPKNILLETKTTIELIYQSIYLILSTRLGERIFNPEFGSNLFSLLFEPRDEFLNSLIRLHIGDAIKRWERRITITSIDIQEIDEYQLNVTINFILNKTNTEGSYVYPFIQNPMPESELIQGKSSIGYTTF